MAGREKLGIRVPLACLHKDQGLERIKVYCRRQKIQLEYRTVEKY